MHGTYQYSHPEKLRKILKILSFINHLSMSQNFKYDKCSKMNRFLFCSQIKCLEFTKCFVRIVNREDPDQKQSDLSLP